MQLRYRLLGGPAAVLVAAAAVVVGAPGSGAYPRAGTTVRISVAADGSQVSGPERGAFHDDCCSAEITSNGRYVAFASRAVDLVRDDTNRMSDVFVKDVLTGRIDRVSVASDGAEAHGVCAAKQQSVGEQPRLVTTMHGSSAPSISDNGRYVAFVSCASNLVPNDRNLAADVFVHDRVTGRTQRASVSSSERETPPDISTQDTQRISRNERARINGNGRYVAFSSRSGALVRDDRNEAADIFVRDLARGTTERVSLSSEGEEGTPDGVGAGGDPAISAGGRYVAFASVLRGLVPGDTNHAADVFVRDRLRRRTERVSVASDGTQADLTGTVVGQSIFPGVPAVYGSVFLSRNGRFVGFDELAANLVPDDRNRGYDAFVHDRETRRTSRVSVDSRGLEFRAEPDEYAWSFPVSMSDNGRYTTFATWRLARHQDPDDLFCTIPLHCYREIPGHYLHDARTGETELLSDRRRPARALAGDTSDGRRIAFISPAANFVKGDTNGIEDVFLHDRGREVGAIAVRGSTGAASNARPTAPRLIAARLIERGDSDDLFGILELEKMGSMFVPGPGVSVATDPGTTYAMAFNIGGRHYEVRISRGSPSSSSASFVLRACEGPGSNICRKVADLEGGYGTTGNAIVFAVPSDLVDLANGERVRRVRAWAGELTT